MRVRANLWAVVMVAVVTGCGPQPNSPVKLDAGSSPPAGTQPPGHIGFSALTLKNPFFKIIADTLTAEARRHGFEVIVSDAERDVQEQSKHVENFLAQKVTAIVLNPADRIAIGPAIKKANEAGIPVFTCDLECEVKDVKVAGHVGTDNYQGGKLAGEAMIEVLGEGGGKVMILHFKQANSCVERVRGFREVIESKTQGGPAARSRLSPNSKAAGCRTRVTAPRPMPCRPIRTWRASSPSTTRPALGAWTALKQVGKADQVKIVGFDGQLEGKQAIKEGKIYADPIQFPEKMGVITMQNIVKYLNGEAFEKVISSRPNCIARRTPSGTRPAVRRIREHGCGSRAVAQSLPGQHQFTANSPAPGTEKGAEPDATTS